MSVGNVPFLTPFIILVLHGVFVDAPILEFNDCVPPFVVMFVVNLLCLGSVRVRGKDSGCAYVCD